MSDEAERLLRSVCADLLDGVTDKTLQAMREAMHSRRIESERAEMLDMLKRLAGDNRDVRDFPQHYYDDCVAPENHGR